MIGSGIAGEKNTRKNSVFLNSSQSIAQSKYMTLDYACCISTFSTQPSPISTPMSIQSTGINVFNEKKHFNILSISYNLSTELFHLCNKLRNEIVHVIKKKYTRVYHSDRSIEKAFNGTVPRHHLKILEKGLGCVDCHLETKKC